MKKTVPTKQEKKIKRRIEKFKKDTGRKRLSRDIKDSLELSQPARVIREMESSKKILQRRIRYFEKNYGPVDKEAEKLLKLNTPKLTYLILKKRHQERPKPEPNPKFGKVAWEALPAPIKRWSRKKNTWLYIVRPWERDLDLDYMLREPNAYGGDDAIDRDNFTALVIIFLKFFPDYELTKTDEGTISAKKRRSAEARDNPWKPYSESQ